MRSIRLRPEHREPVISGRKRSTVRTRLWRVAPDERVRLVFGDDGPPVEVEVERVIYVTLGFIDEGDARGDGFMHVEQLRDALERIYGHRPDTENMTIIKWKARA
jgi:hypothetical protein